ncbi:MAG TPA: DUF308 domain-containing protein [Burkholderiales bacterium]|nr:DUF308 domain-containing protein [Burkholderiales bacterium]
MNDLLFRSWWMLATRGMLAISFGVLALILPDLTFLALIALFAAYALLSGLVTIAAAMRNRKSDEEWWLVLLLGIVGVSAGVVAVLRPDITALALVFFMGAFAMLTGVLDIAVAIRLRRNMRGELLLVLTGVVSVAFGVLVFLFPDASALALIWLIGAHAVATGIMLLVLGLRARRWTRPRMDRRFRVRRRDDGEGSLNEARIHA